MEGTREARVSFSYREQEEGRRGYIAVKEVGSAGAGRGKKGSSTAVNELVQNPRGEGETKGKASCLTPHWVGEEEAKSAPTSVVPRTSELLQSPAPGEGPCAQKKKAHSRGEQREGKHS